MKKEYEVYFTKWLDGIKDEVHFWNEYMRDKGGVYFEGFEKTIDNNRKFVLEDDIPNDYRNRNYDFIDIGSGPFGRCGRISNKVSLNITMVDPLAYIYHKLMNYYEIDNKICLTTGFVEFLNQKFVDNSFDMVHMSNSLDHSFDPVDGIFQMLNICRINGRVILRHHPNEAENEKYIGFHQWNLCIKNNRFIVWRPGEYKDISEMVEPYADVYLYPGLREGEWLYDKVIMVKRRNIQLPVTRYYEWSMQSVYERLLQLIFENQIMIDNVQIDTTEQVIRKMADMYFDKSRFDELCCRLKNIKMVSIYGIGYIGRGLVQLFSKYEVPVKNLIDKNGGEYHSQKIISIREYHQQESELLIVSSVNKEQELITEANKYCSGVLLKTVREVMNI